MIRAYKYKLKPTVKQCKALAQAFGNARFIYNWGLDKKKKAWEEEKKTISYFDLAHELTNIKKLDEYKWLNDSANVSLQQSLRNLDSAYTRFFKAKKGYPKFKSKKNTRDSIKFTNAYNKETRTNTIKFDFTNMVVAIPRIGKVKFCENQKFEPSLKLGTLTVSKDHCGTYWCTIVVDDNKPSVLKTKIQEETTVGIDLGIKDYAILSDGTKYGNPKFLEKGQKRLAGLQQGFAKTQKGSKRRERKRLQIARLHRKIANRRADFTHKLSTDLVRRFDTICLEDLNVSGMVQNHHLANSIQSAAWSEFVRQLAYKAEMYGKNVVFIGRYEPSSKTCSNCGYVNRELKLDDRKWICPHCGSEHDRDINAAINIKKMGLHPQALVAIEQKVNNIINIPSGSGIIDGSE